MEQPQNIKELKQEIIAQMADLSRLLGMISNEDTAVSEARTSFLKLSILIDQALDLKLQ